MVLAASALPVIFLAVRFAAAPAIDVSSLVRTLAFAFSAAAIATIVGGAAGAVAGTLDMPGRRWTVGGAAVLIAAPPAFWWIGLSRLPIGVGVLTGAASGSVLAGLALAPITLLLVLAAVREIPATAYESARVSLSPARRIAFVLLPLLQPALIGGFLLTAILLMGESEVPFLFGFRTAMTDVVTTFSQTFDVGSTLPVIVPLVGIVFVLGLLMVRPLLAVLLPAGSGGRGVIRKRGNPLALIVVVTLPAVAILSICGYVLVVLSGVGAAWSRVPASRAIATVSIVEPVVCAVTGLAVMLFVTYPLRRSALVRPLAIVGVLLFCVPAAVVAIGWIGVGHRLGGILIAPSLAYMSRTIVLPALGFLIAYARMPRSLEDAVQLVAVSPIRRAHRLILPLVVPSLAASAALTAALIFADRDVASLLLQPGQSRLMLNLYLLSANAPSAVIGATALVVLAAGAVVMAIAAAAPFVLRIQPRE